MIAFGLAALHSFGLLATMEVLEPIFKVGERTISVLGLLNGVAILLFLLWISSMLGSSGKELGASPLAFFASSSDQNPPRTFGFLSFIVALSTIGLISSFAAWWSDRRRIGSGRKVVSNLVSGLILLLDRSIKPGDVIEIDVPTVGSTP